MDMRRCFPAVAVIGISLLFGCRTDAPLELPKSPGVTNSAKELTRICDSPIAEFHPRISPDGKKLLYHVRDETKPTQQNERSSIFMKEVGKLGKVPLTPGCTENASWYPDGQSFLFNYSKPVKSVIAKSKIGAGITYVTPFAMGDDDNYPSINPRGDKIAFQTSLGGKRNICLVDPEGMNFTILVEGEFPSWHPSGDVIVYTKLLDNGKQRHIFLYEMESGQNTQLTSGDFHNDRPYFSPTGKYISFVSDRDQDGKHIYIMKSDGSNVTQLTSGKTTENDPCWSSDDYIYFCSNAGEPPGCKEDDFSDIWRLKPIALDKAFETPSKPSK